MPVLNCLYARQYDLCLAGGCTKSDVDCAKSDGLRNRPGEKRLGGAVEGVLLYQLSNLWQWNSISHRQYLRVGAIIYGKRDQGTA